MVGCGSASTASQKNVGSEPAPLVHFPADQASHTNAANEWWYVVGHLRSGSRTFGYEMTIFKFAHITPPGFSLPVSVFRTDVAITDEATHRFHQHVSYYFPQSASLSTKRLAVHVGSESLTGSPSAMHLSDSLPAHVGGVNLTLHSRRTPMYVGGRGYLPFGNGFTYYYSLTDLSTAGTLQLGGHTYSVTGLSWLDHQWGNWKWSAIRGWTWMALQLNNGVQMSVFDFRSTTNRQRAVSAITPDGKTHTIRRMTLVSTGTWKSPHTGGLYPSGWVIRIPSLHARFTVSPSVRDQELAVPGQNRGSYWEGSGTLTGVYGGKHVTGKTYTELTGYAGL
jgi:predicted secreted hydrolase